MHQGFTCLFRQSDFTVFWLQSCFDYTACLATHRILEYYSWKSRGGGCGHEALGHSREPAAKEVINRARTKQEKISETNTVVIHNIKLCCLLNTFQKINQICTKYFPYSISFNFHNNSISCYFIPPSWIELRKLKDVKPDVLETKTNNSRTGPHTQSTGPQHFYC